MAVVKPRKRGAGLRTIWFFLRPHKLRLAILVLFSLAIAYLEGLNVALIYPILEASLDAPTGLSGNPFLAVVRTIASALPIDDTLISNCVVFVLVTVIVFLLRLAYINLSIRTTARIQNMAQNAVFKKYTESDYQFFVDHKQGELVYRATIAPRSATKVFDTVTRLLSDLMTSVSVIAVLASISWKGVIAVAVLGFGYFFFTRYLGRRVSYVAGKGIVRARENENVVLNEYVTGVKQIRASNSSHRWRREFEKTVRTRLGWWRKNSFWGQAPARVLDLIMYSAIGIIVIAIRLLYPDGFGAMVPMFGTFAFALLRLMPRMTKVGNHYMLVMNSMPNLNVVRRLLTESEYESIRNGDRKFDGLKSSIDFKDVSFAHSGRGITLHSINMSLKKNETTALVGPSGSGKSTIVDLLLRMYDVDDGHLYIDGVDIREYDVNTFRARVGFVGQETFIYNASVRDNITMGDDYSTEEVAAAVRLANAHDFVEHLPRGYDTIVGDRGTRLSGGERQRLAIARAMTRKPDILILDEATSALDSVSESVVQQAIDRVSAECTTLVVAHRLSTIRNADIIYVLDQGTIVEQGNHGDLVEKRGKYWEMYTLQNE